MEQLMQKQTQTEQLTIVNIINTGSGFGVTPDGTSVFVPPRVVTAANAEIGDVFSAILIQNDLNPSGRTPFLAVRLDRDTPQPTQAEQQSQEQLGAHCYLASSKWNRDRILEMLRDGYMTSAEVGKEAGTDAMGVKDLLKSMWEKGEIAKAMVYSSGTQKRATHVLWALNADDFL
jgi:hypothetical protein